MIPRERLPVLLLAFALAAALAHFAWYIAPFEDAFITYRYAENLLAGHGLVYNPGEVVEGYTSLLWTLILAGVSAAAVPIELGSQVLSVAAGLGLTGLAALLARQLRGDAPHFTIHDALAALLVASQGTLAYYAGTGMETTLFGLVVGAAGLVLMRPQPSRAWLAGVLLGIGALIRPEGVGYAGLMVLALAPSLADRRDALRVLLAFGAVFLPSEVWRAVHFGHLLPNTYYAKASPSTALLGAGVVHAEAYLVGHGFVLALGAALFLALRTRTRGARVAMAVVGGAIVNVVLVGGDIFPFFRFFLPAIAFGAAAIAVTAARFAPRFGGWILVAIVAASLATEFVPTHSLLTRDAISEAERVRGVARMNQDYRTIGRMLRTSGAQPLLAVNAAGIVPYESQLPTIDMLGLTDAHIAHRDIVLGRGVIGHEKHDAAYVLSRRPDLIVLGLPQLVPSGPLTQGRLRNLLKRYRRYLPGDAEMLALEDFGRWYDPVGIPADASRMLIAFARRGQPRPTSDSSPWTRL